MSSGRALPPLLQPYLALPVESSLILLTSVLGASTNWLVLRYLAAYLTERRLEDTEGDGNGAVKVVFVSFLRDWEFWREGGKRLVSDAQVCAVTVIRIGEMWMKNWLECFR